MINNATLTSVRPPATPDANGGKTHAAAIVVSVPCYCGAPRRAQTLAVANVVSDATAVLYVPLDQASLVVPGAHVVVAVDGLAAQTFHVLQVVQRVKAGGLSHSEAWLKGI